MKSLAIAALALVLIAVACGRYGEPRRLERPAPAVESVPVTDPAVSR